MGISGTPTVASWGTILVALSMAGVNLGMAGFYN
jgi:hypothetical protein